MSSSFMNELVLLPHQQSFVDKVLDDPNVARFYLDAPPGMGKSTALYSLAVEAVRRKPGARVLYVAPTRGLIEHFAHRATLSVPVTKVDRLTFREMADIGGSTTLFAPPGIYVLTLHLAKMPDVRAALLSTKWDLLVCDGLRELPETSIMSGVLEDLADASARAVIAGLPDETASMPNATVMRWDKAAAVDAKGQRVSPPDPVTAELKYPVASAYDRLLSETLAGMPQIAGSEGTLAEALDSSPAAAEMVAFEARVDDDQGPGSSRQAAAVLAAIDAVHADEKLNALLAYVGELDADSRICVATRFVQTAYYLASALTEIAPVELFIAGQERLQQAPSSSRKFVVGGMESLTVRADLGSIDVLILYDSHGSAVSRRLIETANILGRSRPLTVVTLRPVRERVD